MSAVSAKRPARQLKPAVIRGLQAALGPDFPIIGLGVLSGADAVGHLEGGANIVQIYTGLIYRDPALVRKVALALKERSAR